MRPMVDTQMNATQQIANAMTIRFHIQAIHYAYQMVSVGTDDVIAGQVYRLSLFNVDENWFRQIQGTGDMNPTA